MKVSLNWIREYLDFDPVEVAGSIDGLVERIGAQLGGIEEVVDLGARYEGIPIVKVVECAKLENSDHLNKCLVDDGGVVKDVERTEQGLVQVITGAANVHAGMLAVWLPPGVTVPESYAKDPFVLTSRPMRGSMSHGMLASPRELGIGDLHEGILEIDPSEVVPTENKLEPGADFAKVYGLDDTIIDVENKMFTHRPDCFGQLGVAREIAGILGRKFTSGEQYRTLEDIAAGSGLKLEIVNEIPEKVPRFMAVAMKDVAIKPSPLWLQVQLARVGAKPISNVVDVTNYMMLATGQPLHAYDYDKVGSGVLGVRTARPGEKLALLSGKTIELDEADMVITDGDKPIGLAGVMGGADTEVSAETTNIILECATFDMYAIRRASMRHGLFTDAVTRFTKGQSPLQNPYVLQMTLGRVELLAGGTMASAVIDNNHTEGRVSVHPPVPVSAAYINARLGLQLSAEEIKQLLENVECTVEVQGENLTVTAPFWRTDIELREDVVEEVGRLYGFDKLPLELPRRSLKPAARNPLLQLKRRIRENLVKTGANEVLTYSFVHGNLLEKTGQDPARAFRLSNALSPDLQYYRLSLIPSLLERVHPNLKAGYDEFALFELGKTHVADKADEEGLPREDDLTALVVAASDKLKRRGAPYYAARKYLTSLLPVKLTFKPLSADMQAFDITKPYDVNRSALVYAGETFVGLMGEFRTEVRRNLKLPRYCAGFELDTVALQGLIDDGHYVPLPRFPKVTQDITLKVPAELGYQELYDFLWDELVKVQPPRTLPALNPVGIYQREGDQAHKQVTLHFEIASYEKTLTDPEVNKLLESVAAAAREKFGAERV